MTNVDDILKNWNLAIGKLKEAIASRDYNGFKNAYRNGDRCFKDVRTLIQKGLKSGLVERKDELKQTLDAWRDTTMNLKPWMGELKLRLQRARSNTVKGKKIGNNYKYRKNTGRTLSVKAR